MGHGKPVKDYTIKGDCRILPSMVFWKAFHVNRILAPKIISNVFSYLRNFNLKSEIGVINKYFDSQLCFYLMIKCTFKLQIWIPGKILHMIGVFELMFEAILEIF